MKPFPFIRPEQVTLVHRKMEEMLGGEQETIPLAYGSDFLV